LCDPSESRKCALAEPLANQKFRHFHTAVIPCGIMEAKMAIFCLPLGHAKWYIRKMAVRVTISAILPDWWGADEAWEDGGEKCVRELIDEDQYAFLNDETTHWKIEFITGEIKMITKRPILMPIGVHDNVPAADYHVDPAPEPSLTASIGKVLLKETPRHAWHLHPRLNPLWQPEEDDKFDLGSVAHEVSLGRGAGFDVFNYPDWRSGAAKKDRAASRANGRTPILEHQLERVSCVVDAVETRMSEVVSRIVRADGDRGQPGSFRNGYVERVLIWKDIGGPICRCMLDFHQNNLTDIYDLKTTDQPLNDQSISWMIESLGYDLQAAFYIRGLTALFPSLAGRFRWRWIFVEVKEPYEVRVVEASTPTLDLGDRKAALAIQKWKRCLQTECWPGWPARVTSTEPPPRAIERQLERELRDDDALTMVRMNDKRG
jgi:PDDEXK-like domain of unknown function (DUF3799)